MFLPANVQAQERTQQYLDCLARLNLTPPAKVEVQHRAHEANLNEFRAQQPSGINRNTYAADLRDTASQEIHSSFYTQQNAHISGNMGTRNSTHPAPTPIFVPAPGPVPGPAPAPVPNPPSLHSHHASVHSHHTSASPLIDIDDSTSHAHRHQRQASPLNFDQSPPPHP